VFHDPVRQIIRAPLILGYALDHAAIPFAQALLLITSARAA